MYIYVCRVLIWFILAYCNISIYLNIIKPRQEEEKKTRLREVLISLNIIKVFSLSNFDLTNVV